MADERIKTHTVTPEELKYNRAMDSLCATIREAIFEASRQGISPEAMENEIESAVTNALDDLERERKFANG